MQQDQYEKLIKAAAENAYLSIGISADGTPVRSGIVPWERTVSAFNMKPPKITLAASDLSDAAVMEALGRCRIIGCYIFTQLDDYGFIGRFTGLADLFITRAERMRDLTFLQGLTDLFMFYLADASLPDLAPLIRVCANSSGPGKCLGFRGCRIEDTSALKDSDIQISELLVWPAEGDSAERWKTLRKPGIFRFFAQPAAEGASRE